MSKQSLTQRSGFGCLIFLAVIAGVLIALWLALGGTIQTAEKAVENAHRKWDSDDTKLRIEAVKDYQDLLKRTDRMDPARRWVRDDRDTLYRRVVVHEYKFQKNPAKAREYILDAWDEGIRDLRIEEPEVLAYWNSVVEPLKEKDKIKNKNQ